MGNGPQAAHHGSKRNDRRFGVNDYQPTAAGTPARWPLSRGTSGHRIGAHTPGVVPAPGVDARGRRCHGSPATLHCCVGAVLAACRARIGGQPTRERPASGVFQTDVARQLTRRTRVGSLGADMNYLGVTALLLPVAIGCAPTVGLAQGPTGAVAPRAQAPSPVTLPRIVVTPDQTVSVPELYQEAQALSGAGAAAEAAQKFDRVVSLDPEGPLAADALFHGGVAHDLAGDQMNDRLAALERFEAVVRRYPEHALARPALLRSIRLLGFLERWQRAAREAELMCDRYKDLRPMEMVVAHAAIALGRLEDGELDEAEQYIESARTAVEANGLDAAGEIPRDLAALFFALGELRSRRAQGIAFQPFPTDFPDVLERRAQLILDAQAAYSDAMRAHDAHWSAMAGVQVGRLYESLHSDLMAIAPPASATSDRRRLLFEGAMRLRYSVLLDKAFTMMDHTLAMTERTGEHSAWVERAREAKARIAQARAREAQAIDRLPYTRAQLKEALARLAQGHSLDEPPPAR
jgi:hypothetical protein